MGDRLLVSLDSGVADVRLNRPEKRNALDPALFLEVVETANGLAEDDSVRCVVLSGEGASFCAGIDTTVFTGGGDAPVVDLLARGEGSVANLAQQAAYCWRAMPQPTFAAVHGHAYGAGLQLALGCDVRFATPDAKFSVMEVRWGIVPDMCGTQLLPPLVRPDVAKLLAWTARVVSGEEAAALGMVTRVTGDPLGEALVLAHEVAGRNPAATRGIKALVDAAAAATMADGLMLEETVQRGILGTPNHIEAIMANAQGRPPVFSDER